MSNELDKLAAEMRKMKPSKASRQGAMDAAMAAFSAEFSAEETAEKTAEETLKKTKTSEKNTTATQGTAAAARPTGQTTRTTRVQTFGRQTMAKFNALTNFKPQTMMMGGTCAAALIAGLIVFPVMGELSTPQQIERVEPLEVAEMDVQAADEPIAAAKEQADRTFEPVTETIVVTPPSVDYDPVSPINESSPETVVRQEPGEELISIPQSFDTKSESVDVQAIGKQTATSPEAAATTPSQTIVVERRVVKTPASTVERTIPSVTSTLTRRALKEDGTYQTVTETVVTQEASTELVSIPPVFETIKETIQIEADGSQTVLSSEVVPPAPRPQGGIMSVDSLLNDIRSDSARIEAENRQRAQGFNQRTHQQNSSIASGPGFAAPTPPPAPVADVTPAPIPTGQTKIVVPGSATPPRDAEKIGGLTLEIVQSVAAVNPSAKPQFTVFNGVTNEVVESTETIVSETGEILCRVLIPAKYKTIEKQVVVTPAKTEKITIPAVTKDFTVKLANGEEVTKQVVVEEERVDYLITPAVYETRTERVLVEPAREEWKPDSQAINKTASFTKPAPPKYILRDDDGNIVREFENRDAFEIYKANLPTPVAEKPVSTFSVDVDTASYAFMRASINAGKLPPRESIRLEEMINYFPYDYAAPKSADEPFKANVTVTSNPWNADTKLMHVGIKGYVPPASEKPRSNLVFLIDTSGSMRAANKLPLLINSFKLLLNTLDEDDTVSIVAYASASGTVLEPTRVKDKDDILKALNNLRAGGSTAGAAGLELAYLKAQENFDDESVNRVILATDGDFNVGFSSPDDMKTFYETRALKRQDFNNDKVDAGEIGAGHTVTAIYEMTPVGSPAVTVDSLRYVAETTPINTGSDEYAFVKIRHKLPDADTSTLQTFPIGKRQERSLRRASDDMRFATAVSIVGQKLRGDTPVEDYSYADAIKLAKGAKGKDENGYRAEFIQLVKLIETMGE